MIEFDWKETIKWNIIQLRAVGLWPKDDDAFKPDLYAVWTGISVVCIIFFHNFFQAVNVYFILDDLEALTSMIYFSLSSMLGILKCYCIIRNMEKLKQLMVTLRSDNFQPKSNQQRKLVEPSLNFWTIIYKCYWMTSIGAMTIWVVFPLLNNSDGEQRKLPFLAWYPFDFSVTPFYELTYVYQVIALLFVACSTLGADTLIAALNVYIGAQIDLLCDNLKQLDGRDFNQKLIECIKHHKQILNFAEDSSQCFKWIVFFQFFISATSIGITLFQITVVAPYSGQFFSLLSFELGIVVEIFMYCWFGNEVEVKSSQIPYALFESNWMTAPKEAKRNILIFLIRCQRPLKVSALNIFDLSLKTFMRSLRASWSYFALLHRVNSSK